MKDLSDEMLGTLPDVLAACQAAAEVAEPDIAADIRLVADGAALLTPALVAVFADAESIDDLGAIDTAPSPITDRHHRTSQ